MDQTSGVADAAAGEVNLSTVDESIDKGRWVQMVSEYSAADVAARGPHSGSQVLCTARASEVDALMPENTHFSNSSGSQEN